MTREQGAELGYEVLAKPCRPRADLLPRRDGLPALARSRLLVQLSPQSPPMPTGAGDARDLACERRVVENVGAGGLPEEHVAHRLIDHVGYCVRRHAARHDAQDDLADRAPIWSRRSLSSSYATKTGGAIELRHPLLLEFLASASLSHRRGSTIPSGECSFAIVKERTPSPSSRYGLVPDVFDRRSDYMPDYAWVSLAIDPRPRASDGRFGCQRE